MRVAFVIGLLGAMLLSKAATAGPAGVIDHFEVRTLQDAYGGATPPGAAGPYVVITGVVHGLLDPSHPDNADIADLGLAPKDSAGWVPYSTDVVILRPKSASTARRVLFYDVVNRGNRLGQAVFVGGGSLVSGTPPDAGFPSACSPTPSAVRPTD